VALAVPLREQVLDPPLHAVDEAAQVLEGVSLEQMGQDRLSVVVEAGSGGRPPLRCWIAAG
jgi:hypothetical protein